ncbi:MAG: oligosaccharide flippase family protein [bacterium]
MELLSETKLGDNLVHKGKILASGGILTIRNLLAVFISMIGSIFIVRFLGLKIYGLQSISVFFITLLSSIADLSIGLYLLRKPGELNDQYLRVAFSLLQLLAWVTVLFAIFVIAPISAWWYGKKELFWLVAGCSLAIGIGALAKVPIVLIERNMEYGKISMLELSALIGYYLPAAIGAYVGLGIWALILGELSKSFITTMLAYKIKPIRIRFHWNNSIVREILNYGFPTSTAGWVWVLSGAINPILIGKMIGLEAAGIVRLVQGIISQLSFFINIISRLSFNVLGKIQNDKKRILKAIDQSALYSYFLVTFPLFLFASISYWAVPALYGDKSLPAVPLLLLAILPQGVNMIFAGQSFLLMTIGKASEMIKLHIIRSVAVWIICFLLIPVSGYFALPLADIIVLPVLFILHKNVSSIYGRPSYREAVVLLVIGYCSVVLSSSVKIPILGLLMFIVANGISFFVISSKSRSEIFEALHLFKKQFVREPVWVIKDQK